MKITADEMKLRTLMLLEIDKYVNKEKAIEAIKLLSAASACTKIAIGYAEQIKAQINETYLGEG